MSGRLSTLLFGLALGASLPLVLSGDDQGPPRFAPTEYHPAQVQADAAPRFERSFVTPEGLTAAVHAGTLVELQDGGILAAWFGGSREGAADVAIYAAKYTATAPSGAPCPPLPYPGDGRGEGDRAGPTGDGSSPAGGACANGPGWSDPFVITDRPDSQAELGRSLRKLGNPVLTQDAWGRLWLFYVTVSLGGWSTSSISYKVSEDDGRTWGPARRLVTSPFLNISTLVRARPLAYADGSQALPVYHELAGKFGELLRIAPSARVLGKSRMGTGRSAIQPSLVATGPDEALAFLRRVGDSPPRVLASASGNGGATWGPLTPTDLPNPDASVAALSDGSGGFLMAYNDSETGRARLALARSRDGAAWRRVAVLEQGEAEDEFSYPYLIRARNGDFHLIYTGRRTRMVHLRFNAAWLEAAP